MIHHSRRYCKHSVLPVIFGIPKNGRCLLLISPASLSYTLTTREWGVVYLYTNIEERACDLAVYIIENRATVRSAATQFGISKSTVHKDLTERLPRLDPALYKQVRQLLDLNKAERHIRGGLATRRKYKGE